MGSPRDKRQSRAPVDIRCEIGGLHGAAIGAVRDLSQGGCRIFCNKTVASGEKVALTILITGFATPFDFSAEVMWLDMAGSSDLYEIGLRFVHTPESFNQLRQLLWEMNSGNLPEVQRKRGAPKLTRRHNRQ